MSEQILQELINLAEAEAKVGHLQELKQEAIDLVMPPPQELPPDVVQALADIDSDFDAEEAAAREEARLLRERIVEMTKEHGASVKGKLHHAVYSKRTKWDGKKLDGFAMAHPEILEAKTETIGVSIRKVK